MPNSWPRLSVDLPHPRDYATCQACGRADDLLQTWQECDADDQPEAIFVRLCQACARTIVDPHERLYIQLRPGAPAPGAMPCCEGCKHLDGLTCKSPLLLANGGTGLPIVPHVIARGIACTRGKGCRPYVEYGSFPTCKGKEPTTSCAPTPHDHKITG
jgi:hypothetical protein